MDHHSTIKSELLVRTRALPARVRNQSMTKADCHIMSHILWSENSQSHELSANKFNISIQNCRQQITSPERRQHNQVVYIQNWWLKKRVISMAVNLLHLKINIEIFNLTVKLHLHTIFWMCSAVVYTSGLNQPMKQRSSSRSKVKVKSQGQISSSNLKVNLR